MLEIVKGYKVGRAVLFYDLLNPVTNTTQTKVSKDEVVKLCEAGEINNTKIQWWEGKPIVRCGNKNLPIVKVSEDGSTTETVTPVKRTSKTQHTEAKTSETVKDVSSKAVVVGKLTKKKKESIAFDSAAYGGYSTSYLNEQYALRSTINYKEIKTVKDLFMSMAEDYRLTHTDEYLKQFSKKVNPDRKISEMAQQMLFSIQNSINTYLMNMAYKELNEVFVKYRM